MLMLLISIACTGGDNARVPKEPPKLETQKPAEPPAPRPNAGTVAADVGSTPDEKAALAKAEAAIFAVRDEVKGKLGEATKAGVAGAIPVCGEAAKAAVDAQAAAGVKVGRTSTKLRNPANVAPEWAAAWLAGVPAGTKAAGAQPLARIDTTPEGRVARVVRPIGLEAPCVVCHGPTTAIAPDVLTAIQAKYPQDQATGFAVGDLRGALWAETPLSATP